MSDLRARRPGVERGRWWGEGLAPGAVEAALATRPRRFRLIGVGLPKTGTTSTAALFSGHRWGYEFLFAETVEHILTWRAGGPADDLRAWLRARDAAGALEADAASFNHLALPLLVELFPDARWLWLTRPGPEWADAFLNMLLRHTRGGEAWPAWQVGLGRLMAPSLEPALFADPAALEAALPRLGPELLAFHTDATARIAATLPAGALVLPVAELSERLDELAAFVGLAPDALRREGHHENRGRGKRVFLGGDAAGGGEAAGGEAAGGATGASGAVFPTPGEPGRLVGRAGKAGSPPGGPPDALRARDGAALARMLWGYAWRGWFADHPGWTVAPPTVGPDRVELVATGPDGEVALVVRRTGERLVATAEGAPAHARDALLARARALIARGLGWVPSPAGAVPAASPAASPIASPVPSPSPVRAGRLELFLSSGCDLHCAFCCESERIARKEYMSWERVDARLVQAAADGLAVVQFMGGEATLHPRFADAARRAKELGLGTFVITNLLRWERREFADAVAPHLDEIMISIHAWGREAGERVTARAGWWDRFQRAAVNARATLRARVMASSVLTRDSAPDLERIADEVLALGATTWVMGAGVPIVGARADVLDHDLTLTELAALQPRFRALAARCREAGCRLVFFCIPQCLLGPELWDDAHDFVVGDQDLSDAAPADTASVNFWSRADYRDQPLPVTLGRSRPEPCRTCARRTTCGGYFTDYFARHGDAELRPIPDHGHPTDASAAIPATLRG